MMGACARACRAQTACGMLRSLRRDETAHRAGNTIRRDRVVAPMAVQLTADALLFDVRQFTAGGQLAILTDDASACQGPETQEPHETHCLPPARKSSKTCTAEVL